MATAPACHLVVVLCLSMIATVYSHELSSSYRVDDLGESASFNCTQDASGTVEHWILPDMTIITQNMSRVSLTANRWTLTIAKVERESLGDYICYRATGEKVYTKVSLYLYMPSTWELYRMNTIIGLSAAAVLLVIIAIPCLVFHFRWQPPDGRPRGSGGATSKGQVEGATNSYSNEMYEGNPEIHEKAAGDVDATAVYVNADTDIDQSDGQGQAQVQGQGTGETKM